MAFLTFCHVAFFCNLITKWVNIHLGPGVKYAGFALFFVVVCFLSLKANYFKFDKTTEPWGTFFSWRHFGMDHQCISLAFSPKHIWIYWIQLNTVSLIDITVHFFYYLHWDLWNTHCNPAEQKLNRMKSITLLPTYFCVTVKEEAPPKKDTFFHTSGTTVVYHIYGKAEKSSI